MVDCYIIVESDFEGKAHYIVYNSSATAVRNIDEIPAIVPPLHIGLEQLQTRACFLGLDRGEGRVTL